MKTTLAVAGSIALLVVATAPIAAHHSFAAEFDANQPITLKGTVVRMDWINPHSWIHLDVKNSDGTVTRWMIEGGTPNTLVRRGFTKASLQPGTEITVEGFRAKNGANRANGADVAKAVGPHLPPSVAAAFSASRATSRRLNMLRFPS